VVKGSYFRIFSQKSQKNFPAGGGQASGAGGAAMAAQQKRRSGSLTSIFFGRQRRYSLGTMMQDLTGKRASWGETYSK